MRNNVKALIIYPNCVFANLYTQSISINTFNRKSFKSVKIKFSR